MKKSKKYLINPDLKIVKKYHDKTGLKVYIFEQPMTSRSGILYTNLLLEVYEDIVPISARLIANTASLKFRKKEIEELVDKIYTKVNEV